MVHAAHAAFLGEHVNAALAGRTQTGWTEFPVIACPERETCREAHCQRWYALSLRPMCDNTGTPDGAMCLMRSVQQVRSLEGELHARAVTDPLTGLANRISLFQTLEEAHSAASAAKPSALVLIEILDLPGLQHQYGDEALSKLIKGLAGIFRKAIKKQDTIARIEADTFAFVFEGINADEAHIIAERLFTTAENNLVFASETSQGVGGLPLAIALLCAATSTAPNSYVLARELGHMHRHVSVLA
mgnify:CR=1 FL=1